VWKVTFPLLDKLSPHVRRNALTPPSSPPDSTTTTTTTTTTTDVDTDATTPTAAAADASSWDDSKVVALQSIGAILSDFLVEKIMRLSSFAAAWDTFVTHIRDAFLLDGRAVSAPALRCLDRALKAAANAATATAAAAEENEDDDDGLRGSLVVIWEKTWARCEEMGAVIVRRASAAAQRAESHAPFTQDSLVVFVDVVKSVRGIGRTLDGAEWPLKRVATLMAILKGEPPRRCARARVR
jgi:hypothetical protein